MSVIAQRKSVMLRRLGSSGLEGRAAFDPARKHLSVSSSLGLFEVDQDRVRGKEGDHDRQEINEVAHIDDAAGDGAEMAEEARLRDPVDQPFRRPALKYSEDDWRARDGEHKNQRRGNHKGDDLVLGHRRDAGADRQKGPRHQPAGDVAGEDHAIVWVAEKIDGDPEREGQDQRDPRETPRGEEFSGHRLGHADRQCQKQLDRSAPALLGPQPHRQSRYQHDIEPGMKGEEGLEIGLATLGKVADEERQYAPNISNYYHEQRTRRTLKIV